MPLFPGTQLATYVKGGVDYSRSNTSNDYTDGNYRIGVRGRKWNDGYDDAVGADGTTGADIRIPGSDDVGRTAVPGDAGRDPGGGPGGRGGDGTE